MHDECVFFFSTSLWCGKEESRYLADLVTVPVVPVSDCYFQRSFGELTR